MGPNSNRPSMDGMRPRQPRANPVTPAYEPQVHSQPRPVDRVPKQPIATRAIAPELTPGQKRALNPVNPRRSRRWRTPLLVLAVLIFLAGVAIFVYLILGNQKAMEQIQSLGFAIGAQSDANTQTAGDGVVVPTEVEPHPSVYSNYKVAADTPRYIGITKFGANGRILGLGLIKNGNLDVPRSIYDAGWYTSSSKPGDAGAMLVVGHSTGPTKQGIFGQLGQLNGGDNISIERGDGQVFNYKVVSKKTFPSDKVDMASALVPITPGRPGLNLMTCAGEYVGGTSGYSDRVIVYTEQI